MQPVTIQTGKGPLTIEADTSGDLSHSTPIKVKLGEGIFSIEVFLTIEQADKISATLDDATTQAQRARYRAKYEAKGGAA